MSIWQEWFNNLDKNIKDDLIQRLYSVREKQEPIGYSETVNFLISKKDGKTIRTSRLYHEIHVANYNEENCVHYFCQQFGANYEKTYCSPSNGGRWNGWKITLKN